VATIATWDVLLRLVVAASVGALIGIERGAKSHAAGMKTHALVAGGAAIFTLAGAYGFADIPHSTNIDPMRVAAQVVSGIGFVGAGAIIRDGASVRGLTTAATLWASAAVGLAAGAGFYVGALGGAVVVLCALLFLRLVQRSVAGLLRIGSPMDLELDVAYERGRGTLAEVLEAVESRGAVISGLELRDDGDRYEPGLRHVRLRARAADRARFELALDRLQSLPEVRTVEVSVSS